MFDLTIVTRALAGPGTDVTTTVLEETLRLVQGGEPRAAAECASVALADGMTDVRLVIAFLLGVFDERGPASLPEVFQVARSALVEGWQALRPVARKARVADSALTLLFRSIRSAIDFRESKRDATWKAWAETIARDLPAKATAAADALAAAIDAVLESPQSGRELVALRVRTEAVFQRLPPPPPPAPAPALAQPEPEPEPAEAEEADDFHDEPPPSPARVDQEMTSHSAPPPRTIEVSAALEQFIRKLEAFDLLVRRGEMGKAAIVAQDVRRVVERFDPRVYLPALLAPHFRLLSSHIGDIAPHWEAEGAPAWQALEQLYQVDLDAFVGP